METNKIKVSVGDGLPDEKTVGEFYVDVATDIMYRKMDAEWIVKPTFPPAQSPVYYKRVNGEFIAMDN